MKINMFLISGTVRLILAAGVVSIVSLAASDAMAQTDMKKRPSLVITNQTMPGNTASPSPLYAGPTRTPDITSAQVTGSSYYQPTQTIVAQKVTELKSDLFALYEVLREAGFSDAKISVVVTRHNVEQLDAFKALAQRFGATLRITRLRR